MNNEVQHQSRITVHIDFARHGDLSLSEAGACVRIEPRDEATNRTGNIANNDAVERAATRAATWAVCRNIEKCLKE
jgi:hypothetical protein